MSRPKRKQQKSKKKKSRTELVVTPLSQHKKVGKDVLPPFAQMVREMPMQRMDWTGERLPEMLWAILLFPALGRDETLVRFRRLGKFIVDRVQADEEAGKTLRDVTLSGLEKWSDEDFVGFVEAVVGEDGEVFSVMLHFDELPGKARWTAVAQRPSDSFDLLKHALAATLYHQTQEATDCRWMKVLAGALSHSVVLPAGPKGEELAREILEYPDFGDQRGVRPLIRSMEGGIGMRPDAEPLTWPPRFWQQAFDLTKDDHARFVGVLPTTISLVTADQVSAARDALVSHGAATTTGTIVEPRHEATFGLALYALTLLGEALSLSTSSNISGRLILRTLTETLINFSALKAEDDAAKWQTFRDYGYGQAKLAYLKVLETETLPNFITVESLEGLANEDVWHEFREIHIGNWSGSDLRKMSETVGLKDAVYDKYYDWSSAFIHGNWGALRDSCYDLCLNPMHRLHRVLAVEPKRLPDMLLDAVQIVNQILALVDALYPTFDIRLSEKTMNVDFAAGED